MNLLIKIVFRLLKNFLINFKIPKDTEQAYTTYSSIYYNYNLFVTAAMEYSTHRHIHGRHSHTTPTATPLHHQPRQTRIHRKVCTYIYYPHHTTYIYYPPPPPPPTPTHTYINTIVTTLPTLSYTVLPTLSYTTLPTLSYIHYHTLPYLHYHTLPYLHYLILYFLFIFNDYLRWTFVKHLWTWLN